MLTGVALLFGAFLFLLANGFQFLLKYWYLSVQMCKTNTYILTVSERWRFKKIVHPTLKFHAEKRQKNYTHESLLWSMYYYLLINAKNRSEKDNESSYCWCCVIQVSWKRGSLIGLQTVTLMVSCGINIYCSSIATVLSWSCLASLPGRVNLDSCDL